MVDNILEKKFLLGVNTDVRCVHFLDRDQILYSCGNHVLVWRQDEAQVFVHQCSSEQTIRLVQLCPLRSTIAIVIAGKEQEQEQDHEQEQKDERPPRSSPYILFYDAITFRRKKVSKIIDENVTDIICVSLSRNGKMCLVLGGAPDFLLTLWSIEKTTPKVLASMKLATPSGKIIRRADLCPSPSPSPSLSQLHPHRNSHVGGGGDGCEYLICVSGNGILRFFIVDGSNNLRPKTLKLHGEQQNYTHHCWLPNRTVVLVTDTHELLVIADFETKAIVFLHEWKQLHQSITSITAAPLSKGFMVGGSRGSIRFYRISEEDEDEYFLQAIREISMEGDGGIRKGHTHANLELYSDETRWNELPQVYDIDQLESENVALCLLSTGRVSSFPLSNFDSSDVDSNSRIQGGDFIPEFHRPTNGEYGTKRITCMSICAWKPIIATTGSDMTLRIWNYETKSFELTHQYKEEVLSVSLHPTSLQVLVCTKTHVDLSFIKHSGLDSVWQKQFRTNGCSAFSRGGTYFALDMGPFVQVYNSYTCQLVSTLRGHAASIKSLCWKIDDQDLATVSADGVICVWKVWSGQRLLRYSKEKCKFIDAYINDELTTAIINTDSGVKRLDLKNLALDEKFSMPLGCRILAYSAETLICSIENSSGVVWVKRLDDRKGRYKNDSHSRFCLHSRRVSLAKISLDNGKVFTASDDGSLCMSQLHQSFTPQIDFRYNEEEGPIVVKELLMPREELAQKDRDIAKLQQRIESVKRKNEKEFVHFSRMHEERIAAIQLRISEEEQKVRQRLKEEAEKVSTLKEQTQADLREQEKRLSAIAIDTKSHLDAELEVQRKKIQDLNATCSGRCKDLEIEIKLLKDNHEKETIILTDELNVQIQYETKREADLLSAKETMNSQHSHHVTALENQAETELTNEQKLHEMAMLQESELWTRLVKEGKSMQCQHDSISKDLEERRETITSLQEKQLGLERYISTLKDKRSAIQREVKDQDTALAQVEIEINTLTEDIHNMESNKIRQSKMIDNLKINLIPKEEENLRLHKQHKSIKDDIEKEKAYRESLSLKVKHHELKINSMKKEYETVVSMSRLKEDKLKELESRITETFELKEDMHQLKKSIITLSSVHFDSNESPHHKISSEDNATRECESLRRQIETIQQMIDRNKTQHRSHMKRSMRENKILIQQLSEIDGQLEAARLHQVQMLNDKISVVS